MARLLFLTSSFPSSPDDGVCGYVYDLALRLATAHGHEVRVVAPSDDAAAPDADFAPVRVERFRHPWPGRRALGAGEDAGAAVRGRRLARVEAAPFAAALALRAARAAPWADAVCSHWLVPAGAAGALARRGRPHVAVAHGGDVHLLARMPGGRAVARAVAARADRIACVSEGLARRLGELAPAARDRISVVPMGAEIGPAQEPGAAARLRAELGAGDRLVALFLGRLDPIKGADVLLEAAALAPGVDVWVAGDGPRLDRLRERARADTLRVSFLGRVDRRRRRLALEACDVVVVPSRTEPGGRAEGAPVVCAEAVAAGRPVVGTRTGGIAEMVEDGRTGLLVPPEDAAALAGALGRLAADAALRERLREGAAAAAPSVTAAATAARFDALFRELGVS